MNCPIFFVEFNFGKWDSRIGIGRRGRGVRYYHHSSRASLMRLATVCRQSLGITRPYANGWTWRPKDR